MFYFYKIKPTMSTPSTVNWGPPGKMLNVFWISPLLTLFNAVATFLPSPNLDTGQKLISMSFPSHPILIYSFGDGLLYFLCRFVTIYRGPSHTYKVQRLIESSSYSFRIQAISDAGEGPFSDTHTFCTTKSVPPALKGKLDLGTVFFKEESTGRAGSDTSIRGRIRTLNSFTRALSELNHYWKLHFFLEVEENFASLKSHLRISEPFS